MGFGVRGGSQESGWHFGEEVCRLGVDWGEGADFATLKPSQINLALIWVSQGEASPNAKT